MNRLYKMLTVMMAALTLTSSMAKADSIDDAIAEIGLAPKRAEAPADVLSEDAPQESLSLGESEDFSMPDTKEEGVVRKASKKKSKTITAQSSKTIDALSDDSQMLEIEAESAAVETLAFEDLEAESRRETSRLKSEIATLERQVSSSKNSYERARKNSELAHKRLEMKQREHRDRQTRLARAEQIKKQESRRNASLKERLAAAEERNLVAARRIREEQAAMTSAQKTRSSLEQRLKKAKTQLAQMKQRQSELRNRRNRVERQNQKLNSEVTRAESRLKPQS